MSVRKIFEPELDGCSIIIWEAGSGTRVVYPLEKMAEGAAEWLINCANQFHDAKEKNDGSADEYMESVILYGEPITEFEFVRRYLSTAKKAGLEVKDGLVRARFW